MEEEEEEVIIFVEDENDKKYILEVPKIIKCLDLKIKIQTILKRDNFNIRYKNKELKKDKDNEFLQLMERDIIHLVKKELDRNDSFSTGSEVSFRSNVILEETDVKTFKISGLLYFFLVKYIIDKIKNFSTIMQREINNIIYILNSYIEIRDSPNDNIRTSIMGKSPINLLSISNYINLTVKENDINEFLNLININEKNKLNQFWLNISKYEEKMTLFETDFLILIKNSYFDYSLINACIYKLNNKKQYNNNLFTCLNPEIEYLFHKTKFDPSKMVFGELTYSKRPFCQNGICFSDLIDYISFYNDEHNDNENDNNIETYSGKTLAINNTFSFIISEVHYDKKHKKEILYPKDCSKNENFCENNKEKANQNFDKSVEKNGIYIIRIEPEDNKTQKNKQNENKGKFIWTQYIINNMSQVLPLFGFTLKRNEYLIIWKDSNLNENNAFNPFLNQLKTIFMSQFLDVNIYFESCTEKALELIERKKFNKIILISNIGLDLSGKKYVEIARKILGFNIMVLFFSNNNNHLNWIQSFPNSLYTNCTEFCAKYISNYNRDGLINLKKEVENIYKIKLQFDNEFLAFPKFINEKNYKDIIFDEICPNFRKVFIKSADNNDNNYLYIDRNRNVSFECKEGKETKLFVWYVTIDEKEKEITLFSNESYLNYNGTTKIVIGEKYMIRWKYEEIKENNLMIYFHAKDFVLTKDGDKAMVRNKNKLNQIFELIDI